MFDFVQVHISLYADFDIELTHYLRIIRILLLKMRLIMPPRFIVFVSSEDMSFQILIEEVLKLLQAY